MKVRHGATGLLLLALLTGCSLVPGAEAQKAPEAAAAARAGGVVTVGISRPAAVDPGSANEPASRLIASAMCDTLLTLDPVTNEVRPGIVEKWVVSEQYNTTDVVLKLRHGLRFSDGTTVNAKAVQRSLTRLALQSYASPGEHLMREVGGYGAVSGLRPKASEFARHNLLGVQITDPYGLEVFLNVKDTSFLRVLADPMTAPVSERQVDDFPTAARRPVCSGPYALTGDWAPTADEISLKRVPGYHGVSTGLTGAGTGYADELRFKVFRTPQEQLAAFRRHEVDVTSVPLALRAEAQRLGTDLVEGDDDFVQYVGMPLTPDSPFVSADVRVALSTALDRRAIVEQVYGGGRVPADGFLPPALGKQYAAGACGRATAEADVAAAQARVAGSHTASMAGRKVKFYFVTGYGNERLVAAVATQLQGAFGLVLQPVPLSGEAFSRMAALGGGFDGFYTQGWSSTSGQNPFSGDAYLQSLTTLGPGDLNGFSDPQWGRFYAEKVREVYGSTAHDDEEERALAYRRADTLLCDLMPVIPIAFGRVHYLVNGERVGSASERVLDGRGTPLLRELFVRG